VSEWIDTMNHFGDQSFHDITVVLVTTNQTHNSQEEIHMKR